jgi:hypothetical protein
MAENYGRKPGRRLRARFKLALASGSVVISYGVMIVMKSA